MSEEKQQRDEVTGRFLPGNKNGGRSLGSRQLLATQYSDDYYKVWKRKGIKVFERLADEDPVAFAKIGVAMLPKNLDMTLAVSHELFANAKDWLEAFRMARDYIGADPHPMLLESKDAA